MIFTASDVESLSRSLSRWEIGEYTSATLVTVACAGEAVADFTNWFTGGAKEKKERLAKASTLLLVAALSAELLCLVRTNQLSGYVIGGLGEKAAEADVNARTALVDSSTALSQAKDALTKTGAAEDSMREARDSAGKAERSASNAHDLASGARKEADTFEKDIVSAKEKAAKAEEHLADALQRAASAERESAKLKERFAARTLSDKQAQSIAAKIRPFAGQEFDITPYWELKESLAIANRIADVMVLGEWKYVPPKQSGFMLGGVAGVQVYVHPAAPDSVKKAAAALVSALNAENITAEVKEQNPKNPIDLKIALNVGTKE